MSAPLTSLVDLISALEQGETTLGDITNAVTAAATRASGLGALVPGWESGLEDRAAASGPGPLHGVPVVAKDIFDVAGMATSAGTAALAGREASQDSTAVARLRAAGAFIAAKNTLHELSFGITTNNAFSGPARNPFDPQRIPGGSSGGTAVAVAVGMAPIGLAADTGGSSRIPAAMCGLVGFRPTHGRYPSEGVVPISHTRDTPGVIAHAVADVALVDAVLADEAMSQLAPAALAGVRLGVPAEYWKGLHPDVEAVCRRALTALEDVGVELVEVSVAPLLAIEEHIAVPLCLAELAPDLTDYLARVDDGLSVEDVAAQVLSPDVAPIVAAALAWSGGVAEHEELLAARDGMRRDYTALLEDHHLAALVFPTVPLPAPPIGDDLTTELLGEQVPTFPTVIRHANLAGVIGQPGISVPAGFDTAGLPVGLELDGPIGADRALLALAAAVADLLTTTAASAV